MTRYKCYICFLVFDQAEADDCCPGCGATSGIKKMCELDHCNCHHEIVAGIAHCKKCGQPVCPTCNGHDVSQVSRVTGYLSDVGGWNNAKKQELKDRARYDPFTGDKILQKDDDSSVRMTSPEGITP